MIKNHMNVYVAFLPLLAVKLSICKEELFLLRTSVFGKQWKGTEASQHKGVSASAPQLEINHL